MPNESGESHLQQLDDETAVLRLRDDERSLLEDECALLLQQPLPPATAALYGRVRAAAETGRIEASLFDPTQSLLEVGIESGRTRAIHGPHAEMAASRLYARLPRGKAYRATVDAVNEALKTLEGQELAEVSFQASGPGSCTLILDTGARRTTISIRRTGLAVSSLEIVV